MAVAVAALILYSVYLYTAVDEGGPEMETVSFALADGNYLNVSCQVADDPFERSKGLQHRKHLPEGEGMLFVFDDPKSVNFIMPNMNFPLDIIFVAPNGTVLNVEEAEPEDPGTPSSEYVRYKSDGEVMWVVEINQGLSRQYGIGPGTSVTMGSTS